MPYLSQRPKETSVASRIIELLTVKPRQSAVDLCNDLGTNYWSTARVARTLVKEGRLTVELVGKSPHYSLPMASPAPTAADQIQPEVN